jgi:hypothetical protein
MFSIKTRNSLVAVLLVALVSFFQGASPAQAGNVTSLTLVISPFTEALYVNVPLAGSFPTMESPDTTTSVNVQLAAVTVTDSRRSAGMNRTWTTNASITNLVSATDTLTASTIGYSSGVSTMVSGTAGVTEFTRPSLVAAIKVTMGITITGNHVASWRPTLNIPVPAEQTSGTYIGVLTHSVF